MNCRKIRSVVGLAVAVSTALFIGCSNDDGDSDSNPNNPNNTGGGGLVGDWALVSMGDDGNVENLPDNAKFFVSFKSSGEYVVEQLEKIDNFWIGSAENRQYTVKGNDSLCFDYDDDDGCASYKISGNTLTITEQYCYDDECHSNTSTAVKANIASVKSSLGKIYSADPALNETDWQKGDDGIGFYSHYFYDGGIYLSRDDYDYRGVWYAENAKLTLLGLKCSKYETGHDDENEWVECVSTSVEKTVTLDYQLSGETLRLRLAGSPDWDEWTLYDDMKKSKANPNTKKDRRAVGIFKAFRR